MAMNDTEIISNLKKIVDTIGVNAFANHNRANALVSDFFPGNDNVKTRRLIKSIIDVDAFTKVSKAGDSELDGICKALKGILVDQESLSEDRAEIALGWVCGALGRRKPNFPKPAPVKTQTSSTSNNSYKPSNQSSTPPRTVTTPTPNTYGLNLNHHVKRKRKVNKKLVGGFVAVALFAALFAFVIWPNLIYPNLANNDFNTPEIVQSYCYSTDDKDVILTITECTDDGQVKATWEFINDGKYGKVNLVGKIVEKKNNGDVVIEWTSNSIEIMPNGITWTDEQSASISKKWTVVKTDTLTLNAGTNDEYTIASVEDLQKLSSSSGTYHLKNDIDLTGVNWTPIEGFSGMLLGNGYTIKNLKIESSADNVGFFSTLNGIVMNLNFENASIKVSGRHENVGILCGKIESGKVSDISVSGEVDADTSSNVAGIVGCVAVPEEYQLADLYNSATVKALNNVGGVAGYIMNSCNRSADQTVTLFRLENTGKIEGKGDCIGGIIGQLMFDNGYGNLILCASDFKNTGSVDGKTNVGGICGYAKADSLNSYMQDCSNAASIVGESYVGCLAGQLKYITVEDCSNAGSTLTATAHTTIDGEKYAYVGGFVGYGYLANNCTNEVEISYSGTGRYVGGILGYTDASEAQSMTGLKNVANISGYNYVGGIIGGYVNGCNRSADQAVTLSQFENTATIFGKSDYVGGIVGYLSFDNGYGNLILYATEMKNSGNVSGIVYVGGVFGYAKSDALTSYMQDCSSAAAISGEAYVGCIAGQAKYIVVTDCSNVGSTLTATGHITIDGVKYAFVGGYVGSGYLANNCTNEVEIIYNGTGRYVGGIMGYTDASESYSMEGLKNNANISGYSYVGGVIGGCTNSCNRSATQTVSLAQFMNTASVSAKSDYVGGIIGYLTQNNGYGELVLYISDFQNSGAVSGKSYVGGLLGYAKSDSKNSSISDSSSSVGSIAGKLESITTK